MAVALAQTGHRLGVIDSDPQGSLSAWWTLRVTAENAVPLRFEQTAGWRLAARVKAMAAQADVVVIDTPPLIETDAKLAMRLADLWSCRFSLAP